MKEETPQFLRRLSACRLPAFSPKGPGFFQKLNIYIVSRQNDRQTLYKIFFTQKRSKKIPRAAPRVLIGICRPLAARPKIQGE